MYTYRKSHFAGAADDMLLQAATQNVLGAFRGDANQLFGDVLAALKGTLQCEVAGVELLDRRRLERAIGHPETPSPTIECLVRRVVGGGKAITERVLKGLETSHVSFAGAPVYDATSAPTGCLYVVAPEQRSFTTDELTTVERFARIASREFDLISATYTDPSTGCMSQLAFDALLSDDEGREDHQDRGVAAIGVDGLDSVIENHGRSAGDIVLRALAQVCRETFRRSDLVARLGSPRLVALLCEANDAVTTHCVERLRSAVGELRIPSLPDGQISISVGHAGFGRGSLASRVADAEKASYAAARMGGNRSVSVADLRAALRVFKDRQV